MGVDPVSKINMMKQAANFTRQNKRVLWLFMQGFTGTADQAGEKLGLAPLQVRPRCSQLVKLGMLEKWKVVNTGRHSSSWVLRLAQPTPREPRLPL